jgi:hypothetical protein
LDELVTRLPTVSDPNDSEFYVLPGVLHVFLEEQARVVAARLENQTPLLELYLRILEGPQGTFFFMHQTCCARIVDNPADRRVRQRYMFQAVPHLVIGPPEELFPLLDEQVMPELRRIAFAGAEETMGLHLPSLDLLVEYGDEETATLLTEHYRAQGKTEDTLHEPGGVLWKIRASRNPAMLLDQLRSADMSVQSVYARVWSLGRAARLGVDKEVLRATLLEHAGRLDLRVSRNRTALARLKKTALETGVFHPDDLPEISSDPIHELCRSMRRSWYEEAIDVSYSAIKRGITWAADHFLPPPRRAPEDGLSPDAGSRLMADD